MLLVMVVGAFTGVAYHGVREDRLETSGLRLRQVANELASLTEASQEGRLAFLERLAMDPRAMAFAAGVGIGSGVFNSLLDSAAATTRSTTSLKFVPRDQLGATLEQIGAAAESPDRGNGTRMVGPLRIESGAVVSEAVVPIVDSAGTVLGHFVHTRQAASFARIRDIVQELIGGDATFLVGNSSNGLWTDLATAVAGPPADMMTDSLPRRYKRAGAGQRYGAAARVTDTPWIVLIEYPLASVMAPANAFLTKTSGTAIVLIVIGALGAHLLSRRITRPLEDATRAAESLSAGDHSVRMDVSRRDEIGQLADAFNMMAGEVQSAQRRLEDEVRTRTHKLHETLEELRTTQADLVTSEKVALLGQLSSGLGHELRNPLGVMYNAIYYLEAVAPKDDQRIQSYLEILREQVTLSRNIVDSLLNHARASEPGSEVLQLRSIVDTQFRRFEAHAGVSVTTDVPDDLFVRADPVQLGQVVFNLLTNARQALDERGGSIAVSAYEQTEDHVAFSVTDSGCGIAAHDVDRIFEPLYTTKPCGIGLGLSVTRSFVLAHGGKISVESREGGGSVFTVLWPAGTPVGALHEA
jgi:signal transduction histidine kinase